jgi:hypothetical protein
MSLRDEIASWDEKDAVAIGNVYHRYSSDDSFLADVVSLLPEPPLQRGATWLLKHHFEVDGGEIDSNLAQQIYGEVTGLQHWESRLHVLQCMQYLPIPKRNLKTVERFVRDGLVDEIKFVRAWAYNGFGELARQYPKYRDEAQRLCENALLHETAGSVKARVRRVLKQGFDKPDA